MKCDVEARPLQRAEQLAHYSEQRSSLTSADVADLDDAGYARSAQGAMPRETLTTAPIGNNALWCSQLFDAGPTRT